MEAVVEVFEKTAYRDPDPREVPCVPNAFDADRVRIGHRHLVIGLPDGDDRTRRREFADSVRRTRLIALLAVFVAIGLLTGSGAFSSVNAERTVSVNVDGDASALLAMEPHNSSANGEGGYASTTNGQIEINFDGVGGSGVNLDARTVLDRVFNVSNQGSQSVDVWIAKTGSNTTAVTFYSVTVSGGQKIPTGQSETITLTPGDSIEVSIEVDTRGSSDGSGDQLLSSITIHAEV